MQELSGGPAAPAIGAAGPQGRIEAGPGDSDGGYGGRDSYGGGGYGSQNQNEEQGPDGRALKPWQRGPTGGPAPWQMGRGGGSGGGGGGGGGGGRGGHGTGPDGHAPPSNAPSGPSSLPPWQQTQGHGPPTGPSGGSAAPWGASQHGIPPPPSSAAAAPPWASGAPGAAPGMSYGSTPYGAPVSFHTHIFHFPFTYIIQTNT